MGVAQRPGWQIGYDAPRPGGVGVSGARDCSLQSIGLASKDCVGGSARCRLTRGGEIKDERPERRWTDGSAHDLYVIPA